jgi:hypothetical protein
VILISNLILSITDGSTIASTEVYGADKKTYVNIGSGNVFKLSWGTPELTSDTVDRYSLVIKRHDTTLNVYYDIFDKNIGLVNEFYVDSGLLPKLPEQYMLSVYLVAYGKQGSVVTSNVINPYISKGSGAYVKVQPEGYKQPIMKRALAFAKVADTTAASTLEVALADRDGTPLIDNDGQQLFANVTKVLESVNGWCVMQEGRTRDASGTWRINDIKYEVLVDEDGYIITDSDNKPIYVL